MYEASRVVIRRGGETISSPSAGLSFNIVKRGDWLWIPVNIRGANKAAKIYVAHSFAVFYVVHSFVLSSYTMHELRNQSVSIG